MQHLTTEQRNPVSKYLDLCTAREIAELMNGEDRWIAAAVAEQMAPVAAAIERIAAALALGGRLFYLGAGTSGRLGVLDASECPPTFRTPPELVVGLIAGGAPALTRAVEGAEDRGELAVADLAAHQFSRRDVLVGIASSGRTPYVLSGLQYAQNLGAATIGITCNSGSDLQAVAEIVIGVVVGPEILSGSTRLKAGTATKMVLNMLSTGALVLLGKTYGHLMVDLRATNTKLQARSIRIVRELCNATESAAAASLAECDGEVKTAVVALRSGQSPAAARALLATCGGKLRAALSAATPPRPADADMLILGVDGGGSKTAAWLARCTPTNAAERGADPRTLAWDVMGRGEAGGSNLRQTSAGNSTIGFWRGVAEIERAIDAAFAAANLPRRPVAAACLGIAGAGQPEYRERLAAWAQRAELASQVDVMTDVELVLATAGSDQEAAAPAIALVAGTGSIAWGRDSAGRTARAGGWGSLIGDPGSAAALGWTAVRLAIQSADGLSPPTALLPRLLSTLGHQVPADLIAWAHNHARRPDQLASLASLVLATAPEDPPAEQLVTAAVESLAGLIASVTNQLRLEPGSESIVLAGGLLVHHPQFRSRLVARLARRAGAPPQVILCEHPVAGALQVARRHVAS